MIHSSSSRRKQEEEQQQQQQVWGDGRNLGVGADVGSGSGGGRGRGFRAPIAAPHLRTRRGEFVYFKQTQLIKLNKQAAHAN